MEYNTQRQDLIIAEYGRHIQEMVKSIKNITDRNKRTKAAEAIVQVMSQFYPQQKDQIDLKHKLWDHLFMIADFDLDVDSPFSKPSRTTIKSHPDKPAYPNGNIVYRHYGKIMENLIKGATKIEDEQAKNESSLILANQMKKSYLMWNRDSVTDDIMVQEIQKISNGQLKLAEDSKLSHPNEAPVQKDLSRNKKKKKKNFRRKF